jgi:hypothetical protein
VIHHSDHGSQYTSIEFGKRCREEGVRPSMGIPTIATTHSDGSRPLVPIDRDQGSVVLTAPLGAGGDVSLLFGGQARREAVPVVNRRDPRVTRSALTADAAARAGGPC